MILGSKPIHIEFYPNLGMVITSPALFSLLGPFTFIENGDKSGPDTYCPNYNIYADIKYAERLLQHIKSKIQTNQEEK